MVTSWENKKILVLGGTGFVGRNVLKALNDSGISAAQASRSIGVDLRNIAEVAKLLRDTKPDLIINCAAHVGSLHYVTEHAAEIILDNTKMILALYEAAAAEVPSATIIHPIANCAYPGKATFFTEAEWWDGALHSSVFAYGSTRRLVWSVGESYRAQHGIKSVYLLVPNMYGPFDSTDPDKAHALNALISKFVKAQHAKSPELTIWGTGVAVREWLYAEDFGRILVELLKQPNRLGQLTGDPINIGQNFGLSVKELVAIIQSHFSYDGKIVWDTSMPDGAPKKVMDDRKFRTKFPDFKFTTLEQGIKTTIAYYESIYPY